MPFRALPPQGSASAISPRVQGEAPKINHSAAFGQPQSLCDQSLAQNEIQF